jgi:hypothetical protein
VAEGVESPQRFGNDQKKLRQIIFITEGYKLKISTSCFSPEKYLRPSAVGL